VRGVPLARVRLRLRPQCASDAHSASPLCVFFAFFALCVCARVRSRPKNVGEVACQEEVVATLSKSIETANVRAPFAHAHATRTHACTQNLARRRVRSPLPRPHLRALRFCTRAALRHAHASLRRSTSSSRHPSLAHTHTHTRTRTRTRTRTHALTPMRLPLPHAPLLPSLPPSRLRSCRTCCSTARPAPARPAPRWPSRASCTARSFSKCGCSS
jgi:hypothetical protein